MPIKIADELVKIAQDESKVAGRSLTKQIEHWAQIGRAVETLLHAPEVSALKRTAGGTPVAALAMPEVKTALETIIQTLIASPSRTDIVAFLRESQQPLYSASNQPGKVVEVRPGGRRVCGRIVNRKFVTDRA